MSRIDRKALRQAVRERDLGRLEGVLQALSSCDGELAGEMDFEVQEATRLLGRLKHLHHVSVSLEEVKATGCVGRLLEQLPPHPIQLIVLRAVFVALGVPEEHVQDWSSIGALVGSSAGEQEAFVDCVLNTNRGSLPPSDVSRAHALLAQCHLNEDRVRSVYPPLVPFYLWLMTLVEEPSDDEQQECSGD